MGPMRLRPLLPAGSNAERTRLHNRQVVLGQIRTAGTLGRAEIARAAGLSVQAVSNIIAELAGQGMLVEAGRRAAGRGLPAMLYAVNPRGGHAFGVEVRPDALFAAVTDLTGAPCFAAREVLPDAAPAAVARQVARLRDRALVARGLDPAALLGAGVVMPGPFTETGLAGAGTALPGWTGIDPVALFARALGLPVVVENDANAAAMAERVAGVAQGLSTFAFVYFGAGLGLGLVHEGRPFRGAFGNAGEIGHVPVPCAGGVCPLEEVVSRHALRRRLGEEGVEAADVDALAALHAARHPVLRDWTREAAAALALGVATVENLFDPETVILGGALPGPMLDDLVAALPLSDRSVAHRAGRALPRVIRGASGRMTAALGGAALVVNQTFTPALAAATPPPLQ